MFTKRKSSSDPTLGILSLHTSSFTPSDSQLEFENYRITYDVSHFRWVGGILSPNVTLREVTVFSRSYEELKEAVITRIQDQCIWQVIQGVELVNRKPSGLLPEIGHFRGAPFGKDPILREPWLQRLPPNLPFLLSVTRRYSLEETVEIADDIMSLYSPGFLAMNTLPSP